MKKAYKIASFAFSAILLCIAVGLYFAYQDYLLFLSTPLSQSGGKSEQPLKITIKSGSNFSDLITDLEARQLLEHKRYLLWYARSERLSHQLKAGKYHFSQSPTPVELLSRLVSGKVEQHRLTIVEGWSYQQMMAALQNHPNIQKTLTNLDGREVMNSLGLEELHPEGHFYPDTYLFPDGMTDADFLKRAYQAMQEQLALEWENRSESIPIKTPYEALILASIVEKETGAAKERPAIAGVFSRRLKLGMRLQTDPTVIYGMGSEFDGNIRRKDLRKDTPYNTYTRYGLPPTPIALPGKAAIHAALHPESGKSLYFVSRGDGTHQFSSTLQEHNRAVKKYQLRK